MVHEHQRTDRDTALFYLCQNVQGFEDAKNCADATGNTVEQLCSDYRVAVRCNFAGVHFVKNQIPMGGDQIKGVRSYGDLDISSVMLYPSKYFGNPYLCKDAVKDPMLCPLSRKGINGDFEYIFENEKPSFRDTHWVKGIYPYQPPDGHQEQ
jgi:hypothetical protein